MEDDAPLRDAIDNLLKSSGFKTKLFASAQNFLEEFLEEISADIDLLITDIQMPGMTGLELQARLLANGRALPVIAITALLDDRIIRQSLDHGAIACLLKPFDEATLIGAINIALASEA